MESNNNTTNFKSNLLNKAQNIISEDKMDSFLRIINKDINTYEKYTIMVKILNYIDALDKNEATAALVISYFVDERYFTSNPVKLFELTMIIYFAKNGNILLEEMANRDWDNPNDKYKEFVYLERIKTACNLIDLGLSYFEAGSLSWATLQQLNFQDEELITLVKFDGEDIEGITKDNEIVIYREVFSLTTNKKIFILFFVKNDEYLRYIGEVGGNLVHVINNTGTYEEHKELNVRVDNIDEENIEDYEEYKNKRLVEFNSKLKYANNSISFVQEVFKELNELITFEKGVSKAETILNKKYKRLIRKLED